MSKPCKNTRTAATTTCLLAILATTTSIHPNAHAQGMMPGRNSNTPTNTQTQNTDNLEISSGDNLFESTTMLQAADRIFDTDSDTIDFEDGTINWKGKTFNMGDNRVMRARFERYLATPQPEDADQYLQLLEQIYQRVQVNNLDLNNQELQDIWDLLFQAATYEMDAGNCLVIANQVYNAWRIREERRQDTLAQSELENLRKIQQEIVANRSLFLKRAEERRAQRTRRELGASNTTQNNQGADATVTDSSGGGLPSESDFRSTELADTETKIRAIQAAGLQNAVQAKLEFQSQALEFLINRRYKHLLITSSFYRLIFKGSAQNLEVGKKQLTDIIGTNDLAPTIGTLESLAHEAINDVRLGISAVQNNYHNHDRISALQRLQETYFLGEHMPDVQLLDPTIKNQLNTIYRDVRNARKLFDLKDYEQVIQLANTLQQNAKDFPATQLISAAKSIQRLSDLALLSVQQAIGMGMFDKAEQALSRATELWPMNPRIISFTQEMTTRVDTGKQAMIAFDEIHQYGDYRQLYERRAELGVALMSDPQRSEKLAQAVNTIAKIEIHLAQAEELTQQGQPHAAWETLLTAQTFAQDDVKLNKAMAQLAPQVATYVSKLNAAQRHETQQQYATALTHYLAAEDIYPGSKSTRQGKQRLSQALIQQIQEKEKGSGFSY